MRLISIFEEAVEQNSFDVMIEVLKSRLSDYKYSTSRQFEGLMHIFTKNRDDAGSETFDFTLCTDFVGIGDDNKNPKKGQIKVGVFYLQSITGQSLADPRARYQTTSAHKYTTKKHKAVKYATSVQGALDILNAFTKKHNLCGPVIL